MKRNLLAIILLLVCAAPGFCATRVDLNQGWHFRLDPQQQGESLGWQKQLPPEVTSVNVPHTWNLGAHAGYVGKAWYFRSFKAPANSSARYTQIHFGATFYSARIWLNGIEIGHHEGGYTAYSFDITSHLKANNFLAVQVENTISQNTIPGFAMRGDDHNFDWWNYGGIVRDVWLQVGGPLQVQRQQIRSKVSNSRASVEDRILLTNNFKSAQQVTVTIKAFDPDNRLVAIEARNLKMTPETREVTLSTEIYNPKLWGVDRPNVYRIVAEIKSAKGSVLDEQSATFGIRSVEIKDRHLLVNGERVRLTGLTRHEESLKEGLAEMPQTMRADLDDMSALHVTLTRPVHYPQNPFILDYADRHGILLIPEIPVWQFSEEQLKDPQVVNTAKQQIREMIEEAGNHPSIFAWSVCNESATGTPGGIAYFRTMRDYIRSLDPDRFVSFADDNLPKLSAAEQSAAKDADFLMMNQYFGSWHGPEDALPAALEKVNRLFPDKMMIISEFGLPGMFAKDVASADKMRAHIIEEQLPELAKHDWIAGAILWCYQDYKSRRNLRPGELEGFVDHGVVDEKRQRKPSYYLWKGLNSPASLTATWSNDTRNGSRFTVEVKPNELTALPSYPLHHYKLLWNLTDGKNKRLESGEKVLPNLTSTQTISHRISAGSHDGLRLRLTLVRPTGAVAAEKTIEWNDLSNNKPNTKVAAQGPGAQ